MDLRSVASELQLLHILAGSGKKLTFTENILQYIFIAQLLDERALSSYLRIKKKKSCDCAVARILRE